MVEDESFLAVDLKDLLERAGVQVVGPASSCLEALRAIEEGEVDFAILDVRLGSELCYPVADELVRRGIKFFFSTGYSRAVIPQRFE